MTDIENQQGRSSGADQAEDRRVLSGAEIEERRPAEWRQLLDRLCARFATGDFATGLALVQGIGELAEQVNHHPDLDLRYGYLDVRLSSHDVGGITARDIRLAEGISRLAADAGAVGDPTGLEVVELGLDTWDAGAIGGFWAAMLGYGDPRSGDLVDPHRLNPTVWFQETDAHEVPRQRFHLDIWVPPEEVETRIAAAVAAGGTLFDDSRAPSFWVLADRQGNKACLCTWQDRDPSAA